MMISYDIVSDKDIDDIAELFLKCFSKIIEKRFKTINKKAVKDIILLYKDASRDGFIIAKEKGRIIGFICGVKSVFRIWMQIFNINRFFKFYLFLIPPRVDLITPTSFFHVFNAHVSLLAVHPKHTKQGVGLGLVNSLMKHFKKAGVKRCYFQIPAKDSLVKAYQKYGSKIVKQRDYGFGKWVVMYRDV